MVNRIAAAKATNDWIHILQFEQRALGHMGCSCSGVCIDRPADLPLSDEPSMAQKKLEREGKRAISGLTVTIEILFKTSSVHSQQ
jgi:hypothetical protein